MKSPASESIWRLLAISFDPDKADPDLYGLVLEGEKDKPLMLKDRLLFFRDPKRASEIAKTFGSHLPADRVEVNQPFFWCDIAQTLHLLQAGGTDDEACVLGAVNALLDLVDAIGLNMPSDLRASLRSIADYCTFEKNLTRYFEEVGDYPASTIINAILWCIGAITVKSTIVS